MKLTVDYHTHTKYSDGKNTALQNALRAKELGMQGLCISEHGYSHWFRGIKRAETEQWLEELHEAQKEAGIPVLAGMECNIRGISGLSDFTPADYENFDVFLAGIHVVIRYEKYADRRIGWGSWFRTKFHIKPSQSLVDYTTKAYINTVKNNPVDILTHINFLCFSDAVEVAKCCRDYGTYLEISAKKQHLSDEELYKVAKTGVRFVINSDAHSISRIGDCALAAEQIERVGIPLTQIDNIDGRVPTFRFAEYKKHM